jgi:hypothetical protein
MLFTENVKFTLVQSFADLSPLIKKIQRRKILLPASDQLNADA